MEVETKPTIPTDSKVTCNKSTDDLYEYYYENLFPYDSFCRWLMYPSEEMEDKKDMNISHGSKFKRREFNFTWNKSDKMTYLRYRTFDDANALKENLCQLVPHKLDIGAVFNIPVSEKSMTQGACKPLERELVFDIDLTDYNDIRTCCKKDGICKNCWNYCAASAKILTELLERFFDFHQIFWVFSGRRGIHIWVCDKSARQLTDLQRQALVSFLLSPLSVSMEGGDHLSLKDSIPVPLSPAMFTAYKICRQYFETWVISEHGQNLFGSFNETPEGATRKKVFYSLFNDSIFDSEMKESLDSILEHHIDGQQTWHAIERLLTPKTREKSLVVLKEKAYFATIFNIVFYYVYPRIDKNVSLHQNHLLKSVFSIHPSTKNVCVPLSKDSIDSFDPLSVPNLETLYQQLTNADPLSTIDPIHRTDLGPYVDVFERFVNSIN